MNITTFAKKTDIYVFCGILVLTTVLHCINLNSQGIWYDEAFSIFHAQKLLNDIQKISEWDITPPFYYWVLHIWMKFFGISEFAVRFLSVIFLSTAVGTFYLFIKKYFNIQTAIVGSVILAVSNDLFFYSHEARGYTLILWAFMASSWALFEIMYNPKWYYGILLGVFTYVMFYTNYLTGVVYFFQFLIICLHFKKKSFIAFSFSLLTFISLIFSWRFRLKQIIESGQRNNSLMPPTWADLKNFIISFFNHQISLYIYIGIAITAITLLLLSKHKLSRKPLINYTYFVLTGIGIILFSYYASGITPMFLKRYQIYTLVGLVIMFIYPISLINIKPHIKYSILAVPILISALNMNLNVEKGMDYKHAVSYVKTEETKKSAIILQTIDMGALFSYYYNKEIFKKTYALDENLRLNNIFMFNDSTKMTNVDFSAYDKIILMQTFQDYTDPKQTLKKFLEKRLTVINKNKDFKGVEITNYSKI